jgi:hypothetical protein
MKYTTPNDLPPGPCSNFDFGQVEDYCADLLPGITQVSVFPEHKPGILLAFPQPALDWVALELPQGISTSEARISVFDMTGQIMVSDAPLLERNGRAYLDLSAWPAGLYGVQLRMAGRIYCGKIIRG